MNQEKIHYVYVYLDNRKPGRWEFKDWVFLYEPFYVGEGKEYRAWEHLSPHSLSFAYTKNRKIKKILKTGKKPHIIKIAEGLTKNEGWDLEIEFIAHFGRLDLKTGILTNLTNGGPSGARSQERKSKERSNRLKPSFRSKKIIQKSKSGEIINIWDTLLEASLAVGLKTCAPIWACCNKPNKTSAGFQWEYGESSYSEPKEKPLKPLKAVFQYDFEGNFIQSYESATHAEKELNLPYRADSGIQQCSSGKIQTSFGSRWFYEYLGEQIDKLSIKNCPGSKKGVDQFDLNGEYLQSFQSISQAEKILKIRHVGESCNYPFKQRRAGPFYWRFSSKESA